MNSSNNQTIFDNSTAAYRVQYYINNVGFVYVTTAVCLAGLFLHSIILHIFTKLDGSINKYFVAKTIAEMIILFICAIFSLAHVTDCPTCQTIKDGYAMQVFVKYFERFVMYSFHTFTFVVEILITFDRIKIFELDATNDLNSTKQVVIKLAIALTCSFALFVPFLYTSEIKQVKEGVFYLAKTPFSIGPYFKIYAISTSTLKYVILFLGICVLNAKLIRKFRNHVEKRIEMTERGRDGGDEQTTGENVPIVNRENNAKGLKLNNNDFLQNRCKLVTKMLIVLNFLNIYGRLCLLVSFIFKLCSYFGFNTLGVCLDFLSAFQIPLLYSINFFVYLHYNIAFSNKFKQLL
jgi:hypothetical protein